MRRRRDARRGRAAGDAVRAGEDARRPRAPRRPVDGIALDNGQHVLLGAYRQTLALLDAVHRLRSDADAAVPSPAADASPVRRARAAALSSSPRGMRRRRCISPAALLSARGLSWRERVALIAGFRSLAEAGFRRARRRIRRRSASPRRRARAFAAGLGSRFASRRSTRRRSAPRRRSSRTCCDRRSAARRATATSSSRRPILSACFPDAAARFIAARGGTVRCGVAVRGDRRAPMTASRSRSAPAWRRSPASSSPSARISSRAIVGDASGRTRLARAARAGRPLHLRIDHDDLSRIRRIACRSRVRCFASTMRPASGRSTAARRWASDAPHGHDEPDRGRHQRQRSA